MASVTIGDYIYTTSDTGKLTVSVEAEDKSKSSYGPIQSSVEIGGVSYSVTSLFYCFDACTSLIQAPEIPSSVTNMSFCFANCAALTAAPEIPSGVTDMSSCFNACMSLAQAPEIPSSVTNMSYCFYGCESLIYPPIIHLGVTNMSGCFSLCTSLKRAPEIPSSVIDMSTCFQGCTSLTQAPKIPSSVTNMARCFSSCTLLTKAPEIPSSALSMSYCFSGCTSLTGTIIVHNNPTDYTSVFKSIPSLEVIAIGSTDAVYNKWSEITYDYPDIIINDFLDSSVTFSDGDYTYTSSIESETIDNYHQNEDGDDSQAELEWDVAENGEITLCYHASGDSADHTVTFINNGTTQTIGPVTFDGGLTFIAEEGYTIQWLEYDAINVNVYKLSAKVLDKTKKVYSALSENFYINNVIYNLTYLNHCFDSCTALIQAPEIPSSITNMGTCFYKCSSLTRAPEIPSGVTYMNLCFAFCEALTVAPEIPFGVTNMVNCFVSCTSLIQAPEIPSSVTNMESCFEDCTSLTQVLVIPSSVTSLNYCFNGCTSLTQVPEIPFGVTTMGCCFENCTSLTQAPEIPSSVTYMRWCFAFCTALTVAPEIPSSVTDIGYCFDGCTSLTQAPEIPSSVTAMNQCFMDCTSLTGVVKIATSTSQNFNAFFNTTKPIYLINNTSPKDAVITSNLRALAATRSNLYFEADNLTPPSTLLKVARVDDDEETSSTIDGLWAYLNALTTVYSTGLPEGWSTRVNGGVLYADSVDITSSSHMVGPILDGGNRYLTNSWYHVNDLSQHSMNFGIKLDIYDETGYIYTNIYPGNAVILSSSLPLVSYLAGGNGLAIGQACTQEGFECNMPTTFFDDVIAPDMTSEELSDFLEDLNPGGTQPSVIRTIHTEVVTASINIAFANYVSVTAPAVENYRFLCWSEVSTRGWVGSVYPEYTTQQTTNMWNATSGQSGTGTIDCTALYIPLYYATATSEADKVDFIVEQGTSGIWTYRKWDSGIAECWGEYPLAYTSFLAWGSALYYTQPYRSLSFPSGLFVDIPVVNGARVRGVEGWFGVESINKDTLNNLYMMRPTSVGAGTTNIGIIAKGRWK